MNVRSVLVVGLAAIALLTASPAAAAPTESEVSPAGPSAGVARLRNPADKAGDKAAGDRAASLWGRHCQFSAYQDWLVANNTVQAFVVFNGVLQRGQHCQTGKAKLVMEYDGDLVVWDENNVARWRARWTHPGVVGAGWYASYQGFDGNFVVYDVNGYSRWASNTYENSPYIDRLLAIQEDGNVVIYDYAYLGGGYYQLNPFWSTNTHH